MLEQCMKVGQGFMIVYNITSQSSFELVEKLHRKIVRIKDQHDIPIVLVGNKCHLEDKRVIGRDQGANLARQWGSYCSFMETSAERHINISEAFIQLGRLIKAKNGKMLCEES